MGSNRWGGHILYPDRNRDVISGHIWFPDKLRGVKAAGLGNVTYLGHL